jgi:hypothetical protein
MFNDLRQLQKELKQHYQHYTFDVDKLYYADLSDIHLGAKGCDHTALQNTLDLIERIPNFYFMLGGDTLNHANKGSKSSPFEEDMTAREQILGKFEKGKLVKKGAVQYFSHLKDRIIGTIDGNHDTTRGKEFNDISPKEYMASEVGIRYFGEMALVSMTVGSNLYTHFHHHITGSTGKKINLNKLQEKGAEFWFDFIWGEHTHRHSHGSDYVVSIHEKHKYPIVRPQYYINTGSFLSFSGYAKAKGYRIGTTGTRIVELSGNRHDRHVIVYDDVDTFIRLNPQFKKKILV